MANTYSQLYIHVVIVVKGRESLITTHIRDDLYKYISGIISNKNQKLLAIGGMPDHLHIFISMNPDMKLSDLVRDIKANSSKWINENRFVKGKFNWQEGYGAFSYAKSQRDKVIKYIMNQERHHHKKSFREEYIDMLKKYDISYAEKYLFNWIA
ncbi:MAG: IS200/IS605 family transposase [Melioribacteraceae bacterium]|nr:IS200/IS605 family transposase [Melioribacteraceae bacterium]